MLQCSPSNEQRQSYYIQRYIYYTVVTNLLQSHDTYGTN
ncbi:hypothetical protein CRENPOLYSF1_830005 [Crenothrix polyspora]|uniref:Uncharacterized protein n=1 Tax=Crenothrix polyspora TaxID=360316 RepID=A0A1R4HIE1_9GAMM|nr:hypothetical protein CRENPOLYSF1_830005 [Crenothrix polyspora]